MAFTRNFLAGLLLLLAIPAHAQTTTATAQALVNSTITTNGAQQITGAGLNAALQAILAAGQNASNLTLGTIPTTVSNANNPTIFTNTTAVQGSATGISFQAGSSPSMTPVSIGGIWPSGKTYAFQMAAAEYGSAYASTGSVPQTALSRYVVNSGSSGDVLPGVDLAWCTASSLLCTGTNFVSASGTGLTSVSLSGPEIDIEPGAGTTLNLANSIGLKMNVFSTPAGNAIQIGGVGGGSWSNGIVAYNISGSVLSGGTGAGLGSLVNSGTATYFNNAPIILSNTHRVQFSSVGGSAGTNELMYMDAASNFRIVNGAGGTVFRDHLDVNSNVSIDDVGNLTALASLQAPTLIGKTRGTLHTPTSSSEACTQGDAFDDASYHYVCTATNTLKRVALASF